MPNSPRPTPGDISEGAVLRKVGLRLIPFLFLLYVVNLIDRTNIAIAKLQMVDGPHPVIDAADYALGPGLFYIGYVLFEVPSNLILLRVGARAWIARIAVTWGLASVGMMFVTGPWGFYVMRVLLGIAEAGFFPGIIFYLRLWFPARSRAKAVATFMSGGAIAAIIGNPLSGQILDTMNEVAGLWGWQWVFLLEGLPAVLLGFITLRYLPDRPEQAKWLTEAERTWLIGELERERRETPHHAHTLRAAFVDPRVWLLIAIYFTVAVGDNVFGFYSPTFLKTRFAGASAFQIGLLVALPSLVALVGMNLIGWHSDRTRERRWHVAGSAFVAGVGWLAVAYAPSPWAFVVGMAVTAFGMKSMLPTFWALTTTLLSGPAAAGGVAFINSVANLGGFVGPQVISRVESEHVGFHIMAGVLLMGGLLALCVRTGSKPDAKLP